MEVNEKLVITPRRAKESAPSYYGRDRKRLEHSRDELLKRLDKKVQSRRLIVFCISRKQRKKPYTLLPRRSVFSPDRQEHQPPESI